MSRPIPNNHRLTGCSDTGGSNGNRLGLRDWGRLGGRLEGNGKQASTDDARGNDVVVHVISPGMSLENTGTCTGQRIVNRAERIRTSDLLTPSQAG